MAAPFCSSSADAPSAAVWLPRLPCSMHCCLDLLSSLPRSALLCPSGDRFSPVQLSSAQLSSAEVGLDQCTSSHQLVPHSIVFFLSTRPRSSLLNLSFLSDVCSFLLSCIRSLIDDYFHHSIIPPFLASSIFLYEPRHSFFPSFFLSFFP